MNISLQQNGSLPTKRQVDNVGNWVMVFAHPMDKSDFTYGAQIIAKRKSLEL